MLGFPDVALMRRLVGLLLAADRIALGEEEEGASTGPPDSEISVVAGPASGRATGVSRPLETTPASTSLEGAAPAAKNGESGFPVKGGNDASPANSSRRVAKGKGA